MHRPLPADVKAVLFDLDGTLIETDNRWAAQLGKRLAPLRRVAPWWDTGRAARDVIMMIEGPSNYAVAIIERLGLSHLVSELADRVRRSKGLATRDTSELVPGSEQVLEATSQRFKLGVVTTRARREALAFLERWDFAKYFGVVVTRQDCWWMKPHPEPVLKAAAALGVPPERCIMVVDTVADVRAARRAGAYAVGVLCGFGDRRELECAQADLILERPEQLLSYL